MAIIPPFPKDDPPETPEERKRADEGFRDYLSSLTAQIKAFDPNAAGEQRPADVVIGRGYRRNGNNADGTLNIEPWKPKP